MAWARASGKGGSGKRGRAAGTAWGPTAGVQPTRPHPSLRLSFPLLAQRWELWRADPPQHTHGLPRGPSVSVHRPRLALTSALTPPAPLATPSRRHAGLTLPLLPADPRPPRSLLSPEARVGGPTRDCPVQGQPPGQVGGPVQPPGLCLWHSLRLEGVSRPLGVLFTVTALPRPSPDPLQGWACPCPAGSSRPGGAPRAWGGVLLPSKSLFQGRVSSRIF